MGLRKVKTKQGDDKDTAGHCQEICLVLNSGQGSLWSACVTIKWEEYLKKWNALSNYQLL